MLVLYTKKFVIRDLNYTPEQLYGTLDIPLPLHIKKITGVWITHNQPGDGQIGTLAFRSYGKEDVFLNIPVSYEGINPEELGLTYLGEPEYGQANSYEGGRGYKRESVSIAGDSTYIQVLLKKVAVPQAGRIRIYLEVEEVEKIVNGAQYHPSADHGKNEEPRFF